MKKVGGVLFYLTLLIELGIVIVDKSVYINPIEGQLFRLTFALCALKIAMTKYSLKEWLVMAAFFALGAISYFATGRNEIIRIVAFVAASKNIELRTSLKVTFYVTLIGVLSLIGLSLLGIMGNLYLELDFGRGGVERRYCLGLGHPNAMHCMAWALITLGIYLYFERLKWYHYVILEVANIGLYLLTVSRSGVIAATLMICSAAFFHLMPKLREKRWVYICGLAMVVGCVLFSLILSKFGNDGGPFYWMNRYLTGRLTIGYYDGRMSSWSLFSNPANTAYFDMGYMRLFYWYGYIPAVIYVFVNCLQAIWCYRKKDIAALLVIIIFAVYTLFEAHAISVYIARNYVILLLIGVWGEVFMLRPAREGYFWQLNVFLKGKAKKIRRDDL